MTDEKENRKGKYVGRTVSMDDVVKELGDPSTWEAEAAEYEKSIKRPEGFPVPVPIGEKSLAAAQAVAPGLSLEAVRSILEAAEAARALPTPTFEDPVMYPIILDRYQRDNLLWLINACGYPSGVSVGDFGFAHNGDWLGQIAHKIRPISLSPNDRPNSSLDELREACKSRENDAADAESWRTFCDLNAEGSGVILIALVRSGSKNLRSLVELVDGIVHVVDDDEATASMCKSLVLGILDPKRNDPPSPGVSGGVPMEDFKETLRQAALSSDDPRKRD